MPRRCHSPQKLVPFALTAALLAVSATAHAQRPPSLPAPPSPSQPPNVSQPPSPSQPTPTFHVGDHVEVRFLGNWYPATVLGVVSGRWEIAYDDYPSDWNQLVGPERIRPPTPAQTVAPAPASTPAPTLTSAPPPGRRIAQLARLGPGTNVLVEWRGSWFPARVLRAIGNAQVRIRYVGYGPQWDESVGPARVRLPVKARIPRGLSGQATRAAANGSASALRSG